MDGRNAAGDLTVVVIGLNAAATLEACLRSVHRAVERAGLPARVLYVDGGSRDASVAIARRESAEVIELRTDRPTAAKGRNAGWRAASTPLVQFVDSDTVLEPDWLERATRAIQADDRIACLFGQLREANPSGSLFNEVCGCDWYVPPGDWRMCGGNALFRLGALRDIGGSDEQLAAGEEADLCWRLRQRGWRIVCDAAVMGHHDLGMTGFRAYWRRAVRSGYAYAQIGLRFARTTDPMWLRELVRNLTFLPAALLLAVAVGLAFGATGLAVLAALAAARLAWKFGALRRRIPSARLRTLYLAHLSFLRLPLFVGAVQYLARRRAAG
ncbi:glycosyltransferase [Anaeromyxobacter sp. PSR-1]|uniref:glycosyltransferase n=1 Tax=Anaeromyxobacter sp. PSR-1 TaxID=1300915 RepID=UPI0005E4A0F8|nr:glycosyltransferase [Anaeromyxobacter sp. PSR-1]GAO03338.1 putative mycofactocin biosynthesis glycosyltransferase MftF [Anaeromyxobacter sp. PSR-1]